MQRLRPDLAGLNPVAPILTADHGARRCRFAVPAVLLRPRSHARPVAAALRAVARDDPGHTARYASVSLLADPPLDWRAFEAWLRGIRIRHAEALLRVKGMLDIGDVEGPVVVQGVHHVIDAPVTLDAWPAAERRSRLVLIADHATIAAAQASWAEALPGLLAHNQGDTVLRAIDVHVHPMNQAYVEASGPFIPAANRMFKGKFSARPDSQSPRNTAATTASRSRSPGTRKTARPAASTPTPRWRN